MAAISPRLRSDLAIVDMSNAVTQCSCEVFGGASGKQRHLSETGASACHRKNHIPGSAPDPCRSGHAAGIQQPADERRVPFPRLLPPATLSALPPLSTPCHAQRVFAPALLQLYTPSSSFYTSFSTISGRPSLGTRVPPFSHRPFTPARPPEPSTLRRKAAALVSTVSYSSTHITNIGRQLTAIFTWAHHERSPPREEEQIQNSS